VLANIRTQALLLLGDAEVEPVRSLLSELITAENNRAHLAGMISGLDIRYEVDDGSHPLLGARLPELPVTGPDGPTTTTVALREGRGLLIDCAGKGIGPVSRIAASWVDRVLALSTPHNPDGPLRDAGAVLVRPDGHIAWAGKDHIGALSPIRRWFGPSGPGH
jgi:hypothetical protein